jgi:hypothetical protein
LRAGDPENPAHSSDPIRNLEEAVSGLGVAIAFVVFAALAVLVPMFGADSRPGPQDPPEVWFRHCS